MEKYVPYLVLIFSTFFYASLGTLIKKVRTEVPTFAVIAITMLVLFLCSATASLIFEKNFSVKTLTSQNWLILILVGFFNFIGFWLIVSVIDRVPIWQMEIIKLLVPVTASVFAFFLLKEPISPKLFIGLGIISVGLYIAIR